MRPILLRGCLSEESEKARYVWGGPGRGVVRDNVSHQTWATTQCGEECLAHLRVHECSASVGIVCIDDLLGDVEQFGVGLLGQAVDQFECPDRIDAEAFHDNALCLTDDVA